MMQYRQIRSFVGSTAKCQLEPFAAVNGGEEYLSVGRNQKAKVLFEAATNLAWFTPVPCLW